jgi:TupA-like ATPgrasp
MMLVGERLGGGYMKQLAKKVLQRLGRVLFSEQKEIMHHELHQHLHNLKVRQMLLQLKVGHNQSEAMNFSMMQDLQRYEDTYGVLPNFFDPQTFIDKLFYRKYFQCYNNEFYAMLADKYRVREYVKEKIGEEYLIPLVAFFDTAEELATDIKSNRERYKNVVIKANHGWNMTYFIMDEFTQEQENEVLAMAHIWLSTDHGLRGYEPHYSLIKRGLIVERLIGDATASVAQFSELAEYKLHAFKGGNDSMQWVLQYIRNRSSSAEISYFFNQLDESYIPDNIENVVNEFTHYDFSEEEKDVHVMVALSETLMGDLDYARIDWYEHGGNIYFGEVTLTPAAGIAPRISFGELNHILGKMWYLDITSYGMSK